MKGKMWADVWLAEDTGKEPVCLVYESNNRASLYIQAPVLGSFPAVSQKHFQESVFSFLMILGMWERELFLLLFLVYESPSYC